MKPSHLLKKSGYALIFAVMFLGALLFVGCSGDDGSQGPPGPQGPQGPAGESAVIAGESCAVCHGTGKDWDIAVKHPQPTGQDVTLSDIVLTNTGGTPAVSFHAATADGSVTDITFDDLRFYIADLVPAGTPTVGYPGTGTQGTWDTPYFERWAYESSSSSTPDGTFTNVGNGDYTYAFVTSFADATAEAPDYNQAHTQRLVITVAGHDDDNGNAVTNNTVGFLDFVTPEAGGDVTTSVSQRLFVTAPACTNCHGAPFQQAAHADRYLDTRACVICHSPIGHYGANGLSGADMVRDNAYLPILIHQIHAAIDNPAFEDQIRGLGFGAVKYPQTQEGVYEGVEKCVVCHTDSGLDLGTGDETDNWETHPTVEVCGSCHVNFNTVENHGGGVVKNGTCDICHNEGSIAPTVADAHDTTLTGDNVPEFKVTITMTPPVNGSFYVPGTDEAPEVTVTLQDQTGQPVAPAVYTTPQDAAGNTGGGLSQADLFVYGPRAKSVPVLATGTITDPNYDSATDGEPIQGHALFVGGTDPLVTTDATGFHYQLLAVPAGMTPGTYMVRFEGADFGAEGSNYVTHSTNLINFQVGQAAETPKVAGDACIGCHGDTRMHLTGRYAHNVPFDTDYCLACHDQSGNHADPIANRVHAVHSTNSAGDIINLESTTPSRDWSDVTFPQNIQSIVTGQNYTGIENELPPRCQACHTSSDTSFLTNPFMMPCVGCHALDDDLAHMRQNGGPF